MSISPRYFLHSSTGARNMNLCNGTFPITFSHLPIGSGCGSLYGRSFSVSESNFSHKIRSSLYATSVIPSSRALFTIFQLVLSGTVFSYTISPFSPYTISPFRNTPGTCPPYAFRRCSSIVGPTLFSTPCRDLPLAQTNLTPQARVSMIASSTLGSTLCLLFSSVPSTSHVTYFTCGLCCGTLLTFFTIAADSIAVLFTFTAI
mmetsp:Transcript_34876/g.137836  ORF Transcript_34876/g.137836 Transcript_34876/m.137836 type:complete len:203 (-) Transcript_34876:141-749(-)